MTNAREIDPLEAKWGGHAADPTRAQEDMTCGFGMEDRGVPREWNDEYQCLLELPSDKPDAVRKHPGKVIAGEPHVEAYWPFDVVKSVVAV